MRETNNYNRNRSSANTHRSDNGRPRTSYESRSRNASASERRGNTSRPSSAGENRRTLTHEERLAIREKNLKKRKRNPKIFRTVVISVLGIIIISLIIVLFRSCSNGGEAAEEKPASSSSSASESITPSPTPSESPSESTSDTTLLDRLWTEAENKEAEAAAIEAEKQRLEEEEKILANTPTEDYAKEKSLEGKSIEALNTMLLIGDSAYPYYKFDLYSVQDFAEAVNKAPADVNVYSLIMPSKIDVELSLDVLNDYPDETSDQRKAIRYINSLLNEDIIKLNVYDRLKAHCDEDLFFKGDDRITSLASYYAYTLWAEKKGVTPVKFEELEEVVFEGFKGNIGTSTGNAAVCSSEPLKVYKSDTDFSFSTLIDSALDSWPVYTNVTEYGSIYKYSTFLAGSDNYGVITNNEIEGDSACIIVKDASGNSFAPFIAEHYKTTYIVDYRNYSGSLDSLAAETGAEDIIYFVPINHTVSDSMINKIDSIA